MIVGMQSKVQIPNPMIPPKTSARIDTIISAMQTTCRTEVMMIFFMAIIGSSQS